MAYFGFRCVFMGGLGYRIATSLRQVQGIMKDRQQ